MVVTILIQEERQIRDSRDVRGVVKSFILMGQLRPSGLTVQTIRQFHDDPREAECGEPVRAGESETMICSS